jgi:hypothetical protein
MSSKVDQRELSSRPRSVVSLGDAISKRDGLSKTPNEKAEADGVIFQRDVSCLRRTDYEEHSLEPYQEPD